jgi:DNA modification methylase
VSEVIEQEVGERFAVYNGDCVDVLRGLPDKSVGYSIFSPPFASLYTYSNSPRDMGNVRTYEEFFAHFAFLTTELFRVLKPGRLLSAHCMLLPTSKERDGYIGLRNFRDDLIRAFQAVGFIFHSEVVIWKDPVTAMQRTKAIGLLHKQLKKDSALSRQGIPDYLVTLRKPDSNEEPIAHTAEQFPVSLWQQYASPVWMDINPSDTLQFRSAREHDDERHIAPLQLEVIRRGVQLWSNPGDVVLSPFAGIGSEGFVAIEQGRRFIGAELKRSYFEQAVRNLRAAAAPGQQTFDIGAE